MLTGQWHEVSQQGKWKTFGGNWKKWKMIMNIVIYNNRYKLTERPKI